MLATVLLLLGAIAAGVAAISIFGNPGGLWQALAVVSIAQLAIAGALFRRVRFASGTAALALMGHVVLIVGTTLLFRAFGAFGASTSAQTALAGPRSRSGSEMARSSPRARQA